MGPGLTAVRLRDSVQKSQLNVVAGALSRQPLPQMLRSRRTTARLAARYYWPVMHGDARDHVRKCQTCMIFKLNQMQAAGKMLTQVPKEPWATVCADFVGPLPLSKHGNRMLLVLIDMFQKWTELVSLRSATAESQGTRSPRWS